MSYSTDLLEGDIIIRRHLNGWLLINVDDPSINAETVTLWQDVLSEEHYEGDYIPALESLSNCLETAFSEYSTKHASPGAASIEFIVEVTPGEEESKNED